MTSSAKAAKNVRRRSGRVVKKTLADGTVKIYRYPPHQARDSRFEADTIGALIVAYKLSPEWQALAAQTKRGMVIYLRDIERKPFAAVRDVTRRDMLEVRDAIAITRGNGAASGFIRTASALFGWAVDREWIAHSPVHRIKALPRGSLPAWSAEHVDIALDALPEHYRRVILLAAYTGQRRGDLVAMRWSDYDGKVIRFTQRKTGAVMRIPVSAELRLDLAEWKAERTADTILTDEKGNPWTPAHLTERLARVLPKIDGLPPKLTIHGVRKFRAADLANRGASVHEIAAITGHRTLSMVEHYTRSADQERLAETAVGRFTTAHNRTTKPRK